MTSFDWLLNSKYNQLETNQSTSLKNHFHNGNIPYKYIILTLASAEFPSTELVGRLPGVDVGVSSLEEGVISLLDSDLFVFVLSPETTGIMDI